MTSVVKNIAKVVGLKVFEQVLLHPKSDDPNDDERVFGRVFHHKGVCEIQGKKILSFPSFIPIIYQY